MILIYVVWYIQQVDMVVQCVVKLFSCLNKFTLSNCIV